MPNFLGLNLAPLLRETGLGIIAIKGGISNQPVPKTRSLRCGFLFIALHYVALFLPLRCAARRPAAQGDESRSDLFTALKGRSFTEHSRRRLCHKGIATRASTPPREARVGNPDPAAQGSGVSKRFFFTALKGGSSTQHNAGASCATKVPG